MSEKQSIDRRQMLKEAAIHLACRNGYDRTTIKDIAQKCDVTVGTIYHYFASKEDLFKEALVDRLPRLDESLPEISKLPIEEGLVQIAMITVNGLRQRAEMVSVICSESLRNPEILCLFVSAINRLREALEKYLEDKIAAGEIGPNNVKIIFNIFFGHFFTYFFHKERLGIQNLPPLDEQYIRDSVKTLLVGWKQGGSISESEKPT